MSKEERMSTRYEEILKFCFRFLENLEKNTFTGTTCTVYTQKHVQYCTQIHVQYCMQIHVQYCMQKHVRKYMYSIVCKNMYSIVCNNLKFSNKFFLILPPTHRNYKSLSIFRSFFLLSDQIYNIKIVQN